MSRVIHQPADKLMKLSLGQLPVALDFFKAHLPPLLLAKTDLSTLKLEKQSFVGEGYKETAADILYSATINGEKGYLFLLCEHQSRIDQHMALRLLRYNLDIIDMHLSQNPKAPLPVVYNVVVYTGKPRWTAPLDIFELFGDNQALAQEYFLKPYQLLDVQRTTDDELRQQTLYGVVAFALKYRKAADFAQFLDQLMPWIHEIEQRDETGTLLGRFLLKYVMDDASQGKQDLLIEKAQHYLSHNLQGEVMTIAQQLRQEGMQAGIQQGMQQGMQEGELALLKRQLQRRFGELPANYLQRLANADADTLLHWGDRIFDATELSDIFKA